MSSPRRTFDARVVRAPLDLAPDGSERRLRRVEEIHRHLRARRIGELESERLHRGKAARGFADLFRDPLRDLHVRGVELDVERDERRPRADDDRARLRVEHRGSGVGRVRRREHVAETLVLRLADVREADALRTRGGARVEVDGDLVPLGDLAPEGVRQSDAFFHRHAGQRHERHDIHRAEARVLALVRAHVDLEVRGGDQRVRGGCNGVGVAGEREDRAVVIDVAGLIEEPDARNVADGFRESVDHVAAAALADVGHAFHQPRHGRSLASSPICGGL